MTYCNQIELIDVILNFKMKKQLLKYEVTPAQPSLNGKMASVKWGGRGLVIG